MAVETAEEAALHEVDSTERAFRYLEGQILDVRIAPGERIAEAEVARALGMSRGPVREALRKLESFGLVVRRPNRGVQVAEFDEVELEELDTLRSHLLALTGRLAARRASPAQVAEMETLLRQMKSAVGGEDDSAYADLNFRFHGLLNEMSGHAKLSHHLSLVYRQIRRYHVLAMSFREAMLDSYESHGRILGAIRARDAQAAETELANHGRLSYRVLKANFERLRRAFRTRGPGQTRAPGPAETPPGARAGRPH